jgi:hypothetical protein
MRQQITWQSSAEVLEYYPPDGRPTSGTVVGYSQGTSELWSSEAVTLDPYTDTVSSVSSSDRRILTVGDTTNAVIGRRYWFKTSTGGRGHEVEVSDIPSSTSLRLSSPLRGDISSGVIEGHRLARTITETSAIWRNARAVWTLTYSDGTRTPKNQWFDIVPLPLTLWDVEITEYDLESVDTDFGEAIDTDGAWRKMVDMAFHEIWRRLEKSYKPDLLRTRAMLRDAIIYRTLYHRFRNVPDKRDLYEAEYDKALGDVLGSREAWYDGDDDLLRSVFGRRIVQIGDDFLTVPVNSVLNDDNGDTTDGERLPAANAMMVT